MAQRTQFVAVRSGFSAQQRKRRYSKRLAIEALEMRQMMSVAPLWASAIPTPSGAAADAYEADNTFATAKTIAVNGDAQSHSLHNGRDRDFVRFTLSGTTHNVVIETDGVSGDTQLRLYDASGRQIAYNDDGGNGLFSRIAVGSLPAGTYYARVNDYGWDGTIDAYTIQITAQVSPAIANYMLTEHFGGRVWDADKSVWNTEDDYMCWAGAAANVLQWTGWGDVAGMGTADQIFAYFQEHWTDLGGNAYYGWDWWFDGTNDRQGDPDPRWSQVDVPGGGFFPGLNLLDYLWWESDDANAMFAIEAFLRDGRGVGLSIGNDTLQSGHALTCWGFSYDSNDPEDYRGIWVTDSDDNEYRPAEDRLCYYEVVRTVTDSGVRWYLRDSAGITDWYLSEVAGLAQRDSALASVAGAAVEQPAASTGSGEAAEDAQLRCGVSDQLRTASASSDSGSRQKEAWDLVLAEPDWSPTAGERTSRPVARHEPPALGSAPDDSRLNGTIPSPAHWMTQPQKALAGLVDLAFEESGWMA